MCSLRESLHQYPALGQSCLRQNDRKLVSTCTSYAIVRPKDLGDSIGHFAQSQISLLMTECIIDSLEAIKVSHYHASAGIVAACPVQLGGKLLIETCPIEFAGNFICADIGLERIYPGLHLGFFSDFAYAYL